MFKIRINDYIIFIMLDLNYRIKFVYDEQN